jgi:hypothetical protein
MPVQRFSRPKNLFDSVVGAFSPNANLGVGATGEYLLAELALLEKAQFFSPHKEYNV